MNELNRNNEVDIQKKYNFVDAELWHKHDTEYCNKCSKASNYIVAMKLLEYAEYPQELGEYFSISPYNVDVHKCPNCNDYRVKVYGWDNDEY